MTVTELDEVLAAKRARAAAVVARDIDALAPLLHDGLTYIHATAVRLDRDQFLKFVQTGPRFLSVELQRPQVLVHGACAVVTGELRLRLQREPQAQPIEAHSWASQVWLRCDDPASVCWRLALFQSTAPMDRLNKASTHDRQTPLSGESGLAAMLKLRVAIQLAMAGRSWTEAADASGFADLAHLTRTFRRMFGINPAALMPR